MGLIWTPEVEGKLRAMAAGGHRVREIADEIGVTRNAIIGKAHRIGVQLTKIWRGPDLKPRKNASLYPRNRATTVRTFVIAAKKRPVYLPMPPEPEAKRLDLLELNAGQCRFPVTDDHPMLFCAHEVAPGSSYCAHHHRVCHAE